MLIRTRTILLLLLLAAGTTAVASGPAFWTLATAADFLKGTSDGVSVSAQGVLTPGPSLSDRLAAAPPQVWSLATDANGTLWAGTGGDGRLLRIRPGQPAETAFDSEEANVFAVAVAGARVFAATSPDGRVYVIDANGQARPFFDPEEKYIWALAVDGTGRLWVGAGQPAVIYRVDASGTGTAIYRPPAAHVVTLTLDRAGRVLAGTDSPGRLYRFGADDRPFALLDSGLKELRAAVAADNGVIYAAALGEGGSGEDSDATTTAAVSLVTAAPTEGQADASASPRSRVFRIDPDGGWEPVWETSDAIYDLAIGENDSVWIATGPAGRLYRLDGGRDIVLVTGVDSRQITRLAARAGAGVPAAATANPGRVLTAPSTPPAVGSYTSLVKDSRSIARWGLIRWESAGEVRLFTRSGNTETPDDSWSPWSDAYTAADGAAIASPPARFIQWKAELTRTGAASRLTSVTVAYLPANARPAVTSITVHPPGVVFQKPFSNEDGAIAGLDDVTANARRPPGEAPSPSPPPGRRMYQKGLQTIAWKADDADDSRLTYSIDYRREGEADWRPLRTGLLDPLFVWDTTSVPDGRYVLRIAASDEATNPAGRALTGSRESDAFDVDNTPPQIDVAPPAAGQPNRLAVRVRDGQSPIEKLEYSVGGGVWQVVYPADGLADSPDERYVITLPAGVDATRLVLRATDRLQNVASSSAGGR